MTLLNDDFKSEKGVWNWKTLRNLGIKLDRGERHIFQLLSSGWLLFETNKVFRWVIHIFGNDASSPRKVSRILLEQW
ncbi:Sterol uptake control protein 2 [Fusarium oxysporum f. sp. albedinis]|nr:Sterol uptake control protein 2 [Fusarium oxysporum f. sp. albedinis]